MQSSFLMFFLLALSAHAQDFLSDLLEGATQYDYDPTGMASASPEEIHAICALCIAGAATVIGAVVVAWTVDFCCYHCTRSMLIDEK